jgi:hypothetical protein
MKRLIGTVLVAIFLTATPVQAQTSLRDLLADEEPLQSQPQEDLSLNDYANLYFKQCAGSNVAPELQNYIDLQCACTAAEMTSFMKEKDLEQALTKNPERDYQMLRIVMNAYIPCLKNSIKDFTYDQCVSGAYEKGSFSNKDKVCSCIGDGMALHAVEQGTALVPGFARNTFKASDMGDNPFFSVINHPSFPNVSDYYTRKCLYEYSYNY